MENIKQQAAKLLNFPTDKAGLGERNKSIEKNQHMQLTRESEPNHIRRGGGIIAD